MNEILFMQNLDHQENVVLLNSSIEERVDFILHLADTNLILSQRNAEWCGHGPILEQDIAITNISLDLLGQARNFYQHAAHLINKERSNLPEDHYPTSLENGENIVTEDSLAYLRSERLFKNLLITELPRGDWAQTILRQFFYSNYQILLYKNLQNSDDEQLVAIATKSLKEVIYHLKWSSEWVIRLGDGTTESKQRLLQAFENLWQYTGEFFMPAAFETQSKIKFDIRSLKPTWLNKVIEIFKEATINDAIVTVQNENIYMHSGGKNGIHTEQMGYILAEMQYLQRAYPGAQW